MTGTAAWLLSQGYTDEKIAALPKAFIPQGSILFENLPATPTADKLGYIWNITNDFTTDSRFIEGAGKKHAAGNNVAIVKHNDSYMYDVMSAVDLSNYYTKAEVDTKLVEKLNILPKVDDPSDPGFGWEYHIPYNFDVNLDANQANIKLKTLTLDNKVTKMDFDKVLPSATTSAAGLMSANDKVEVDKVSNKLDILPKVDDPSDPGFGWEYHIPYNFEATPDAEKINITLKTLTLDNKFTKMNFDKFLPGATTTTAGLMTAADKVALDSKQNQLTAGTNIQITNNTISATNTKYTVTLDL